MVAAQHHEPQLVRPDDHRERLQQRAGGDAERARDGRHGDQAGRLLEHRLRQPGGQLDRLGVGARDLDVGGVAGRERDRVLARRARRHVLVRGRPAHHPDVGLDPVPVQPRALEDPVVGADVLPVAHLQALGVAVEGVGVLHDELARPQHRRARARLVALLRLEVVEDLRQVAVRAHDRRHVERDVLLVRHRQHELGAPAVLQLEQLRDRVAAAALPQLGRVQDRHQHLQPADRVHLLADDLHDVLVHPPARRHPGPEPGAELADHARADEQLVRERLRVGGRLLLGREEVLGEPCHAPGEPSRREARPPARARPPRRTGGTDRGVRSRPARAAASAARSSGGGRRAGSRPRRAAAT